MVYQNKLVAVIKHNGKILREKDNNLVYLPFLAEYEIFIKNLESRDVVINITIDGEDVLDKQQLVIRANSTATLEGFLKDNKVTNRFKFIQLTGKIQEHRQDKIDDGIIRLEYKFVKQNCTITTTHPNDVFWFHPHWCECPECKPYRIYQQPFYFQTLPLVHTTKGSGGAAYSGTDNQFGAVGSSNPHLYNSSVSTTGAVSGLNNSVSSNAFMPQFTPSDEGITVKGGESSQTMTQVQLSPLEDASHTIILKLRGYDNKDKPLEKPVLVKTKLKCTTCGRTSKSNIRFCPECGTALF